VLYKVFLIFGMIYSSINRVYMTNMGKTEIRNSELKDRMLKTSAFMMIITIPGAFLLVLLQSYILEFFNVSLNLYEDAFWLFILLSLFHLVNSITGISSNILIMRGYQKEFRCLAIFTCCTLIVCLNVLMYLDMGNLITTILMFVIVYAIFKFTAYFYCISRLT
jgi:hypothetical protein